MEFDKISPCFNCPFRRHQGIRLRPGRIEEIANNMLDPAGTTFVCHKTRKEEGYKQGEKHCAGALIFAEKHENATQMMRIAERLRIYDAAALRASPDWDEVFDSIEEMHEHSAEEGGETP